MNKLPRTTSLAALSLFSVLLAAHSARAASELAKQVQIESKFVEIDNRSIREIGAGLEFMGNVNTSIAPGIIQPGGVKPQSLGTFPVAPSPHLPRTGDIRVLIAPEVLQPAGAAPRVTTASAQHAVIEVVRDVTLGVHPVVGGNRQSITLQLRPEQTEFSPWSVDVFGTVAIGNADRRETTTRDVTTRSTRIVDVPTEVLVPFDNGTQIVDRRETQLVPTKVTNTRTNTVSETHNVNRLGNVAGGGGMRVNYLFNPNFGASIRGEVLGGNETLGLVTGSLFANIPTTLPVTPSISLGGGVLFPHSQAVLAVGLGVKKPVTPSIGVFSELNFFTDFGHTNIGEFNAGISIQLGQAGGAAPQTSSGPREPVAPSLGRIPVTAHVFRERTGPVEKRDILIFVTPRVLQETE